MKLIGQISEIRMRIDKLFDADVDELIAVCGNFNTDLDDVPVEAIRSNVENYLCKGRLAKRVIMPIERIIQESDRFSLLHQGRG